MTIRTKLILWYSGLLTVILCMFGVSLVAVSRYVLLSNVDLTLRDTADQVLRNSRAILVPEFGSPNRVIVRLPELDIFRASGVVVQVWEIGEAAPEDIASGRASEGEIVTRLAGASDNLRGYDRPLDADALDHEKALYLTQAPLSDIISDIRINGGDWRIFTRPYDVWGARRVIVQTATSTDAINQAGRGLTILLLTSLSVALAGSIALGMGLSYRAMRPIMSITSAAQQIVSADDLKKRLVWTGPMDELGRLTAVLNQMLGRLDHLFSVQQRFVADVSHELRTPLTAIRGHVDLIKRYGMDVDSLDAIESEVGRMSRLVNDLLLLARADYGGLTLEKQSVDALALLQEVQRDAVALAKDRTLRIRMGETETTFIQADPNRLKQLLLNLLSNAIKFTPDGGSITLELHQRRTADGSFAVIDVRDTGIGIAPQDLPHIFDRFYQADSSRTRHDLNDQSEGAGLGLSIARWIAEAHGGRIAVESAVGVGSLFSVYLPLQEELAPETGHHVVTRPRLGGIIRRTGSGGTKNPSS